VKSERLAEINVRQKYVRGLCNSNGECGHSLELPDLSFRVPGSPPRNESDHTFRKVLLVIPPPHDARTSSHRQPSSRSTSFHPQNEFLLPESMGPVRFHTNPHGPKTFRAKDRRRRALASFPIKGTFGSPPRLASRSSCRLRVKKLGGVPNSPVTNHLNPNTKIAPRCRVHVSTLDGTNELAGSPVVSTSLAGNRGLGTIATARTGTTAERSEERETSLVLASNLTDCTGDEASS